MQCGANKPTFLRGTKLTKHITTKCMSLKLNETSTGYVSKHLGHHEKIYKSHYQVPIPALEIVNVFRLLEVSSGINKNDIEKRINENYGILFGMEKVGKK